MQNPLKQLYNEEYYRQRSYEFDTKYPYFDIIAKWLVEKFKPKKSLDIGCAKGYMVYALREAGVEAYGVDISEYAISNSPESVRGFLRNIDVDFEKLPFESETFDMTTSLECMEHLQNHNNVISEMKRVLKPGGIVLIATPNQYGELLGHLVIGSNPSHVNVHSKSFWINTFRSHGFHYLGNFPEQVFSKARHALAAASKEAIAKLPPGKIGRYLFKFGKPGKWLRDKLAHLTLTCPGAKFMAVAVLFKLDETAKL